VKVEFTPDEAHAMLEAVITDVTGLKLEQADRAAVRRWLLDDMKPSSSGVKRLADKLNDEIQKSHDKSEVSVIKKPDWL